MARNGPGLSWVQSIRDRSREIYNSFTISKSSALMPVQIQEVGGERILVKFSHKFNVLKNFNISLPLQLTSIRNADPDPRDFNHADQCRSGSTSLIFSRKNCCPKLTKLNLFAGKRPLATRLAFDESMNETGAAPKQPRLAPDPFHSLAGQTFSTIQHCGASSLSVASRFWFWSFMDIFLQMMQRKLIFQEFFNFFFRFKRFFIQFFIYFLSWAVAGLKFRLYFLPGPNFRSV